MTDELKRRPTFSDLPPGAVFAQDFRVVRPLSTGGMGAVYVVDQLSTRKRRALKVMRPEYVANEGLRRRFVQESRVSAQIESDHVVEVIGAGVDEASGIPWLAMELLNGFDLESFARRNAPLKAAVVRTMFEQLCHALGDAHDKGIIHRDLKPENVFLASPRHIGAPFTVKILDFGIAKALAEAKTHTTDAVGTPLWMSPEQTSPSATIAPSSDVWALGLLAFRLLAGKIYWLAAHHPEISAVMALRETLIDPIPLASVRAAALGGHPLPGGFDAWFSRCVVRDVSLRFANAREAYAGLDAALGEAARGPAGTFAFPSSSPLHHALSDAPTELDATKLSSSPPPARSTTETAAALDAPNPTLAAIGSSRGRRWISVGMVSIVLVAAVAALGIGLSKSSKTPPPKRDEPIAYETRVLADEPAAYFRFSERGPAVDLVRGIEGIFVGAHGAGPSPLADLRDQGVRFTGGRFEIPAEGLAVESGALTVEAWIQAAKIDEQHRGIVDVESAQEDYEGYRMYVARSGGGPVLRFGRVFHDAKYDVRVDYPDDGAFHHVVGTYDGEFTTCLYVDAKPKCDAKHAVAPPMKAPRTILVADRIPGLGKGELPLPSGETSPGAFQGVIDELVFYSKSIDELTVKAHFDGRVPR